MSSLPRLLATALLGVLAALHARRLPAELRALKGPPAAEADPYAHADVVGLPLAAAPLVRRMQAAHADPVTLPDSLCETDAAYTLFQLAHLRFPTVPRILSTASPAGAPAPPPRVRAPC